MKGQIRSLMIAILIMGIACAAGCAPPEGIGGVAVDAVDAAHERAKLTSSEPAEPQPDPWPDMPEEIRSEIVTDAMAGVDPRLVDVEQRLATVEQRVESQAAGVDRLADRVDVLENLPKAPAPTVEELSEMRSGLDRQAKQLAALMAKVSGCKCGPICTCGPDCKCPDACSPDCPCQQSAKLDATRPATGATLEPTAKPYASVTMLSLPGCPPCEQWKREVLPRLLEQNWPFFEETLTSGRAPQFRICIGDACYIHHGFMTGNDLAAIVRRHNGEPEPIQTLPLFGRRFRG